MTTRNNRDKTLVTDILKAAGVLVNGNNPWDIQVHDERLYSTVLRQGALGLGEAYMKGWWDCKAVDLFLARLLDGNLVAKLKNSRMILRLLVSKFVNLQTIKGSREVGELHYDIEPEVYERMLDSSMNYTCGYWRDADNLEDAQIAKMDLICRKLKLREGMRLLDIGCGWGGFARFAAENYGVSVVGVTISKEQEKYAKKFCKDYPVEIRLQDYREVSEKFDCISAIGMFEHVGCLNYKKYMEIIQHNLVDGGLFLFQTNGMNGKTHGIDEWIRKYIFPNAMLPTTAEITSAFTGTLTLEDWHNFGDDYIKTLKAWHLNFKNNWKYLHDRDEEFYRMWTYFLFYFLAGYRAKYIQLWQVVLSNGTGTRNYRSVR